MPEQPKLPCNNDNCPINSVTATSLGFLKLFGQESEVGKNIIKRLERGGLDPSTLAECTRQKCGHLVQMRRQSDFAKNVVLASRLARGTKTSDETE